MSLPGCLRTGLCGCRVVKVFRHVQQASGWTTVNEIATATGVRVRTVRLHSTKLTKDGIFERELTSRTFRYRLAPDATSAGHWFRLQEAAAFLGL
jgi:DNA-binding IclR family transcriptional regulator